MLRIVFAELMYTRKYFFWAIATAPFFIFLLTEVTEANGTANMDPRNAYVVISGALVWAVSVTLISLEGKNSEKRQKSFALLPILDIRLALVRLLPLTLSISISFLIWIVITASFQIDLPVSPVWFVILLYNFFLMMIFGIFSGVELTRRSSRARKAFKLAKYVAMTLLFLSLMPDRYLPDFLGDDFLLPLVKMMITPVGALCLTCLTAVFFLIALNVMKNRKSYQEWWGFDR